MKTKTIGFIGFVNLPQRLYPGFSNYLNTHSISCHATSKSMKNKSSFSLSFIPLSDLVAKSDMIILAVKPQQLSDIATKLAHFDLSQTCIVSLLAGIPLSTLSDSLPNANHIIRVMPNTCAEFNESMTVYCASKQTHMNFESDCVSLFSSVGSCIKILESQMDLATAVFGSGPAFFYQLINSATSLLVQDGFDANTSRQMINQLLKGVSTAINNRTEDLPQLIKEIKSPNGTTAAGLDAIEAQDLPNQWASVFKAAAKRSKELSNNS